MKQKKRVKKLLHPKLGAFCDQGFYKNGEKNLDGVNGGGDYCISAKDKNGNTYLIKQDNANGVVQKGKVAWEDITYQLISGCSFIYVDKNDPFSLDGKKQISEAEFIKLDFDLDNTEGLQTTYIKSKFIPTHKAYFWQAALKWHYREKYKKEFEDSKDPDNSYAQDRVKFLKKRLIEDDMEGLDERLIINLLVEMKMATFTQGPKTSIGPKAYKYRTIIQNYLAEKPYLKNDLVRLCVLSHLFGNLAVHPRNFGIEHPYHTIKLCTERPKAFEEGFLYLNAQDGEFTLYSQEIKEGRQLNPSERNKVNTILAPLKIKDPNAILIEKRDYLFEEMIDACNVERLTIFDYGAGGFNLFNTTFNPITGDGSGLGIKFIYKYHLHEYGEKVVRSTEMALALIRLCHLSVLKDLKDLNDLQKIIKNGISEEKINKYMVPSDLEPLCQRPNMSDECWALVQNQINQNNMDEAIQLIQHFLYQSIWLRIKNFQKFGFELLISKFVKKNKNAFFFDEVNFNEQISKLSEHEKNDFNEFKANGSYEAYLKKLGVNHNYQDDLNADQVKIQHFIKPIEKIDFLARGNRSYVGKITFKDGVIQCFKKNIDNATQISNEIKIYADVYPDLPTSEIRDADENLLGSLLPFLGKSLDLDTLKTFDFQKKLTLFKNMVKAVGLLQKKNILHRNITLDQFVEDEAGNIHLVGFGKAVYLNGNDLDKIGFKSDVFSLGKIGKELFDKETFVHRLLDHATDSDADNRSTLEELDSALSQFQHEKIFSLAPSAYTDLMNHYSQLVQESQNKRSNCAGTHAGIIASTLDALEAYKKEPEAKPFSISDNLQKKINKKSKQFGKTVTHKTSYLISRLLITLGLEPINNQPSEKQQFQNFLKAKKFKGTMKFKTEEDPTLKEKFLSVEVDNHGIGDGGLDAFAIGLINVIQREIAQNEDHFLKKLNALTQGNVKYTIYDFKNFSYEQYRKAHRTLIENLKSDFLAILKKQNPASVTTHAEFKQLADTFDVHLERLRNGKPYSQLNEQNIRKKPVITLDLQGFFKDCWITKFKIADLTGGRCKQKYAKWGFTKSYLSKDEIRNILLSYTQGVCAFFGRTHMVKAKELLSMCSNSACNVDAIMESWCEYMNQWAFHPDSSFFKRFEYIDARYRNSQNALDKLTIENLFLSYVETGFNRHHKSAACKIIMDCRNPEETVSNIIEKIDKYIQKSKFDEGKSDFKKRVEQLDKLRLFYNDHYSDNSHFEKMDFLANIGEVY